MLHYCEGPLLDWGGELSVFVVRPYTPNRDARTVMVLYEYMYRATPNIYIYIYITHSLKWSLYGAQWSFFARYVYTYKEFVIVTEAPQCNRMTATGQDTENKIIYKYTMYNIANTQYKRRQLCM